MNKDIWKTKDEFLFDKAIPMKLDNKLIVVHLVIDGVNYWDMILSGEKQLKDDAIQYIKEWAYWKDIESQQQIIQKLENALKVARELYSDLVEELDNNGRYADFQLKEYDYKIASITKEK